MSTKRATRVLSLSLLEWAMLEELAKEHTAYTRRGVNAHQNTWMELVRLIAQGKIKLVAAKPYPHLDRFDRAIAHPPQEEQPAYTQMSILEPVS